MRSSLTEVTLADLLHKVPRLWEFLDCWDKQVLRATSCELRRQVSELVTSIKSDYKALGFSPLLIDISWLVSRTWTQLRSLELTLDPALVPELSNGAWPLLANLALNNLNRIPNLQRDLLPAELDHHIFDGFKGKWPLLERLAITLGKLNSAHITALVDTEWTSLKTLHVEPLDRSLPHLMRGNWPQLKDLALGVGLSDGGLQALSACPWSTLERLELVHSKLDLIGMESLIQAGMPQLTELSLCQVSLPEADACFSQLAQGRWPMLAVLQLELMGCTTACLLADSLELYQVHQLYSHARLVRVRQPGDTLALTLGKWPCLQRLTLENFPIFSEDVTALVQADWLAMTSLTMLGCFQDTEAITLCMQRWPGLRSLELGSLEHTTQYLAQYAQSAYPTLKFHAFDVDGVFVIY